MRTLIFVLTYEAESHVPEVLSRIPRHYINSPDTDILVLDDASTDQTATVARTWAPMHQVVNLTVLQNRQNQGYGGNQKVGYRYAIQRGYDVVVMLHGDAQYSPEHLPLLLEPLSADPTVDCVLGVRFGRQHSPLKGGMPLYKFVGNRILTAIQNRLAQVNLSEWHTGYRAYRTSALGEIAFELNTNDFHFDTEILLQLIHCGRRLVEVNVPTHYGSEVCRVRGLRYAKDVLKATFKFRLQRYNLLYDVRYHPEVLGRLRGADASARLPVYGAKPDTDTPHAFVIETKGLVPEGSRVLDIGCSTGHVAHMLAQEKQCHVVGIDLLPFASVHSDTFSYHAVDLERDLAQLNGIVVPGAFDVILMLDVLEHLSSPETFLLNLSRQRFSRTPMCVFSTGNVAFFVIRFMLLLGFFNYGEKGILDVTHKRLFSLRTFRSLLEQTGFVVSRRVLFPFPFQALGFPPRLAAWLAWVNRLFLRPFPSWFAYQVMFVAHPLQLPEVVLEDSLAGAPRVAHPNVPGRSARSATVTSSPVSNAASAARNSSDCPLYKDE